MKDNSGMCDELYKEEYRKGDYKKVYLILYNLFQFTGFSLILAVMAVRYMMLGDLSMVDTYEHVGPVMKFLQLLHFLEVVHPLFGFIKGSVVLAFLQVSGRASMLFGMIDAEPRMHAKPVIFYLFIVWSLINLTRYLYYITRVYKKEVYTLTWLRFSLWIPLYPIGIICEAIVLFHNIPYLEETKRFSISLPNAWNFAFHMPTLIRVYLLLLMFPTLYIVMSYMYKLRTVRLKPKVVMKMSK